MGGGSQRYLMVKLPHVSDVYIHPCFYASESRLKSAKVALLDEDYDIHNAITYPYIHNVIQCGEVTEEASVITVDCEARRGRYVFVYHEEAKFLTLCEVEVFKPSK